MPDSQSAIHTLDAAVALTAQAGNRYAGHTSPDYANMVGPFGGAIGATLLNAVMLHPERLGDPLTLTVNFAAPIADGEFSLLARVMRTNRSTQHWMVELQQDGQVAAFATAITAVRRETWSETDAAFPLAPPPAQVPQSPAHPRAAWTGRYEMRFISGMAGQPETDTGGHPSETRLWIRDQPPRPLDFLSLAAMCDAFYPRVLVRRPTWTAAGTVALTTYFHADAAQLQAHGDAPLLGAARALRFSKGFFDQSAEMWTPGGVLLATSHQVVYFKD